MTTVRPVHRFTMKKGIVAPIGLAAMVLASLAVGLPAAQAANDGDQRSTDAVFGKWAWSGFTAWQTDQTRPADPDGQDGDHNVANVTQIGERYEKEVPGTSETVLTGWLTEEPGEGWTRIDQEAVTDVEAGDETVVVKDAYDEVVVVKQAWTQDVFDHWQRYSWAHGQKGDTPPAFPDSEWQVNVAGDPHRHRCRGSLLPQPRQQRRG